MYNIQQINDALQVYFNSEKYEEAIKYLEQIKKEEASPEIIRLVDHHLGKIYFFKNDFELARKIFAEIIQTYPQDFYAKIFLSQIYSLNNKPISSMKLLEQAFIEDESQKQILYSIKSKVGDILNDDDEIEELLKDSRLESEKIINTIPKISIIVLCYNKVDFTAKCLKSLFKNTSYGNYEVIVVDNASVDETPGLLQCYGDKIKFIHSNKNLGFVGGNNYAAKFSTGEFIVFLNNDTEVLPNWLEGLYSIFKCYPDAGAAGSMLVYPDGILQEAGGAIFNDMSGWNYGKFAEPIDSKFTFVREVDYCSGASLMVRKDLFFQLGGFDERFAPAYCEDTDLCFSLRKLGYKVYYSPFSKVVHFEGATSGTDLTKGFKKYQVINAEKFKEKWSEELKLQYPNDPDQYFFFTNRKKGKRILIIDDIPPLPDRAAGALRHYHTLTQMLELGYQVTYVHLMGRQYTDQAAAKTINNFKMRGVEFIWFDYESWWEMRETTQVKMILKRLIDSLDLKRRKFDLAYIAFWHIANYFVDIIREQVPDLPILVDTMDIHYLREQRQAEMSGKIELKKSAEENKRKELALYSKVDCITTVTENDRDELRKHLPNKSVVILTDVHDPVDTNVPFEEREGFLFVGNFNHSPNEDAIIYFKEKIFPHIKKKIPEAKFYIVGNSPTEKILKLKSDDIIVTGWVPEILPYLKSCRVSVVPLRYGAGNKGKVGETLSHGLPMVSTTIGAEGMNIVNRIHSFVSDDPLQFANYAIELYSNKDLWQEFSIKGKEIISEQYSSALMKKRLEYIISFSSRTAFKGTLAINYPNPPKVSIILITYNQLDYTRKCIDSVLLHTNISYEIIVIDNASKDDTVNTLKRKYPEVRLILNNKNLGFPIAVNQGINNALGEYILILNNDTVVTDNWLERMIEVAESNSRIGLVGPISNIVSGLQIDNDANYNTIEEMHEYSKIIQQKNRNEVFEFPRIAFLCTLIKKEVVDKIGGLDERFTPGNFEDDDFCLRAQLAGYKTVIAKDVFIHHFGSKSFKADGEKKYAEQLQVNKQKFVNKWGATPEELWLQNKTITQKQVMFPINSRKFIQFYERSKIHMADNDYLLAFDALKSAVEYFNVDDACRFNVTLTDLLGLAGNVGIVIGNLEQAKICFEKELNLDTNSSSACVGLGEIFFINENYDAAKTLFEWAVKNNEQNQAAIKSLIKVNSVLGLEQFHNSLVEG